MTTPARQSEADKAAVAFHLALTQIGVGTIEEAIALWDDVNPAKVQSTATRWLTRAVALIMSRRRMSRDLAFAYYRLARALRTGSTIADPYDPEKTNPTLGDVRREFASMLDDVERVSSPPTSEKGRRTAELTDTDQDRTTAWIYDVSAPDEADLVTAPLEGEDNYEDDSDRLLLEELEDLARLEDELERAAEEEARSALEALGTGTLNKRLREPEADPEEAHRKSGARQAGAAERIVLNGARSTAWIYAQNDKRVIGWARVSRTGTPCGFCAMLLSRGFTPKSGLYRTKAGGGGENPSDGTNYDDGDLYHDNCHCYAEPIYSTEQYEGEAFALNREYAELWPKVTEGYGGKDALNAWRRYINAQRRAQVAAAPTN